MLGANSNNVALIWKNIKFTLDPNIGDLEQSRFYAAYETDMQEFSKIFSNIAVNKASQIFCHVNFDAGTVTVTDANKGVYEFNLQFACLATNEGPSSGAIDLNFRVIKSLTSLKTGYNRIRFFIYQRFIRVDFINYFEDDDEAVYDKDNKMITVIGKCN